MQLGVALNFKDLCIKSENQLREVLLQANGTKVEFEDDDVPDDIDHHLDSEISTDLSLKVLHKTK